MPQNKATLTQFIEFIKNLLKKSNQLLGPSIENSIQDSKIDKEGAPLTPNQKEGPSSHAPITFAYKSRKNTPKLDTATQELLEAVRAISSRPEDKPKR